ncbi:MAG: universal stress protein, partial [Rhodospirillales bacterium]|nr:universal stress protein [Rhodospirillales bacterium]
MKSFKNILVVYNRETFNVSTLRRAGYIAAKNDAHLTFMEVVEDEASEVVKLIPKIPGVTPDRVVLQEREDQLALIADSVSLRDVDYNVNVVQGRPFMEIIRAVLRAGHDLVLITADGRPGFRQLFFGATSMHLMRKCPCPVWVIKPGRDRFTRILAAVDIDPTDPEKSALCRKILELSTSLAESELAHLDVVHAWSLKGREAETQR